MKMIKSRICIFLMIFLFASCNNTLKFKNQVIYKNTQLEYVVQLTNNRNDNTIEGGILLKNLSNDSISIRIDNIQIILNDSLISKEQADNNIYSVIPYLDLFPNKEVGENMCWIFPSDININEIINLELVINEEH